MIGEIYDLGYIVVAGFVSFLSYRIYRIFFETKGRSNVFLASVFNYIVMAFSYLFFDVERFQIVFWLLALYILTFGFEMSFRARIITSVSVCALYWGCNKLFIYLLSGFLFLFRDMNLFYFFARVTAQVLLMMIVTVGSNVKRIRNQEPVPIESWFVCLIFPVIFLMTAFALLSGIQLRFEVNMLIEIGCLGELVIIFYYYDGIFERVQYQQKQELSLKLNRQMQIHYQDLKLTLSENRKIQHDIKNHLISLDYMLKHEKYDEAREYLDNVIGIQNSSAGYPETGNIALDAMIQTKKIQARQQGIHLKTEIAFKELKYIEPYALTIVLGNLLDNAITATLKNDDKHREISLKIKTDQDAVFIRVKNFYSEELVKKGDRFISTKTNPHEHGRGLKNVKEVIDNYFGNLDITTQDSVFKVSVMMEDRLPKKRWIQKR